MITREIIGVWDDGSVLRPGTPVNPRRTLRFPLKASVKLRVKVITPSGVPIEFDLSNDDEAIITARKKPLAGVLFSAEGAESDPKEVIDFTFSPRLTSHLEFGRALFDVWLKRGGDDMQAVIPLSPLVLEPSVTNMSLPPAGGPAVQAQDERSFLWQVPTTGSQWTVSIPGTGMVDASYSISYAYADVPDGGAVPILAFPTASRQTSQFAVSAGGVVEAGTTIEFILRDRA